MSEPNDNAAEVEAPKGITCVSNDCVYHNSYNKGRCSFQNVYLRKGTCRYYREGKDLDRTDLGDGDYMKFVYGDSGHADTGK